MMTDCETEDDFVRVTKQQYADMGIGAAMFDEQRCREIYRRTRTMESYSVDVVDESDDHPYFNSDGQMEFF